jgi:hypothetical protein
MGSRRRRGTKREPTEAKALHELQAAWHTLRQPAVEADRN